MLFESHNSQLKHTFSRFLCYKTLFFWVSWGDERTGRLFENTVRSVMRPSVAKTGGRQRFSRREGEFPFFFSRRPANSAAATLPARERLRCFKKWCFGCLQAFQLNERLFGGLLVKKFNPDV